MTSLFNRLALCAGLMLLAGLVWPGGLVLADERPFAPPSIPGAVTVSAEEAAELILARPGLIVIDARMNDEYAKGHIEGSINLLNTSMRPEDLQVIAPDKMTSIMIYCNGERCLRSSDAVKKAMEWGYKNVYWFRGGWNEWIDKGLPVIVD